MDDFNMDLFLADDSGLESIPDEDINDSPEEIKDKEDISAKPVESDSSEEVGGEDQDEGGDSSNESKSSPKGTNVYTSLANALHEKGALPSLDPDKSKIESVEDLIEAVKTEIKTNEYSGLTDSQKRYLEALEKGVPETVAVEREQEINLFDDITDETIASEDNEELRKDLMVNYYRLRGFNEEEAQELTEQQVELGKDIETAKKAATAIKQYKEQEYNKKVEAYQNAKIAEQERLNKFKETVYNTDSVIDGLNISKKVKDSIYDAVTKVVETTEDGRQLNKLMKYQSENPIEYQYKIAYLFEVTNGFKDFSKFTTEKKAKSNAAKELDALLRREPLSELGLGSGGYDKEQESFGVDDKIKFDF